jgi:ParB/RepB/Spo0J family partition protein
MSELKEITINEIIEPDEGLRKVDRKAEKYLGLVEAIRLKGLLNPISVREVRGENGEITYGLVDGLHRLNACRDVGHESIPCHVTDLKEADVLETQVIANVHTIETKPVEYSKALLSILASNPLMSKSDLAGKLAKTSSWIGERLGLLKLTEEVAALVDDGKIGLSNAYALTKLDAEGQVDFVDRAISMSPQEFIPTVNARVKEIRDDKRKGKDAKPAVFVPVAMLRGRSEVLAEMEKGIVGASLIREHNLTTLQEAFIMAIKWVLQVDPNSAALQKAQDDERREERKKAQEASTVERKRKRAKEAAEKAAQLQKEAEEAQS